MGSAQPAKSSFGAREPHPVRNQHIAADTWDLATYIIVQFRMSFGLHDRASASAGAPETPFCDAFTVSSERTRSCPAASYSRSCISNSPGSKNGDLGRVVKDDPGPCVATRSNKTASSPIGESHNEKASVCGRSENNWCITGPKGRPFEVDCAY